MYHSINWQSRWAIAGVSSCATKSDDRFKQLFIRTVAWSARNEVSIGPTSIERFANCHA